MKDATKRVKCKVCGFVAEIPNKPGFAWMDKYNDCLIGRREYCEKLVTEKSNKVSRRKQTSS